MHSLENSEKSISALWDISVTLGHVCIFPHESETSTERKQIGMAAPISGQEKQC